MKKYEDTVHTIYFYRSILDTAVEFGYDIHVRFGKENKIVIDVLNRKVYVTIDDLLVGGR